MEGDLLLLVASRFTVLFPGVQFSSTFSFIHILVSFHIFSHHSFSVGDFIELNVVDDTGYLQPEFAVVFLVGQSLIERTAVVGREKSGRCVITKYSS